MCVDSTTPTCQRCGKPIEAPPSHLKRRKHCSRACYDAAKSGRSWVSRGGYRFLWVNGREVQEHRHIMEQHIGRPLADDEEVHHRNGDKLDNRIENLQLLTKSEHMRLHYHRDGKLQAVMQHAWSAHHPCCVECGTTERPHSGHGLCHRCYQRHYLSKNRQIVPRASTGD